MEKHWKDDLKPILEDLGKSAKAHGANLKQSIIETLARPDAAFRSPCH
jgi:hypothetical protein